MVEGIVRGLVRRILGHGPNTRPTLMGVILSEVRRALHEHHGAPLEKEREPYAVFEGRITLNQISAAALTGECELGPYDPKTGERKVLKEPTKVKSNTRLTTFLDDDDGEQQMTVRWEKSRGKIKLEKARTGQVWRIEFYKVSDLHETAVPTVPGTTPEGFSPFGGQPSGGMS